MFKIDLFTSEAIKDSIRNDKTATKYNFIQDIIATNIKNDVFKNILNGVFVNPAYDKELLNDDFNGSFNTYTMFNCMLPFFRYKRKNNTITRQDLKCWIIKKYDDDKYLYLVFSFVSNITTKDYYLGELIDES